MSDRWTWTSDIRIPNNTTAGKQVVEELLAQLTQNSWGEHDTFGVHLAIEEAMVNAIKHGNQDDPEKTVHVSCQVSPDEVRIEIQDEGEGFDPADVPDPTEEENLEVPSGRGLMLMRTFMTSVEYNDAGNQVIMYKDRNDVPDDDDDDNDDE